MRNWCFADRASWYNPCKKPTWLYAPFFHVYLFLFSTCFGQPCAHHQENYYISATPGLCHSLVTVAGVLIWRVHARLAYASIWLFTGRTWCLICIFFLFGLLPYLNSSDSIWRPWKCVSKQIYVSWLVQRSLLGW